MRMPRPLAESPPILRFAFLGAFIVGALGCITGLIIGLNVYAPTAWAATIEVGLPAAILGAVLGVVTGAIVQLSGRGASRDKKLAPR